MLNTLYKYRFWCILGFLLSVYSTYVKVKVEYDKSYSAMCDISPQISCTTVFSSFYGKGFGLTQYLLGSSSSWNLPNGVLGLIFYASIFLLSFTHNRLLVWLQLFLGVLSNLLSVYLAYLLYFVLEDLCVVCVALYFVNFFCLKELWKMYEENWCDKTNAKKLK